ncbi:MAG: ribonuclease III [Actinobacteria bacterium]|nr:ribonuclease III [Actinomycetota bacterium]
MTSSAGPLAELFGSAPEPLRRQALSHSSWVEARSQSYGRLAFLGDSVLGLAINAELLGRLAQARSGELTKILNQSVSQRACAEVARELGIPGMIEELAPGDANAVSAQTLTSSEHTLAEVCEAVIGACFEAHGFDTTAPAVVMAFEGQIGEAQSRRMDFKSELQERLARDGATVSYEVSDEAGPAHKRTFEVRAMVAGEQVGVGSGRSKKEAEQAAAQRALEGLRR